MKLKITTLCVLLGAYLLMQGCATTNAGGTAAPKNGAKNAASTTYTLTGIEVEQPADGSSVLSMKGSIAKNGIKVNALHDPIKLVVDVEAKAGKELLKEKTINNSVVKSIKTETLIVEGKNYVRLEILCSQPVKYSVVSEKDETRLTMVANKELADLMSGKEEKDANSAGGKSGKKEEPVVEFKPFVPSPFAVNLTKLRIEAKDGSTKIVVTGDKKMKGFEKGASVFGLTNPKRLVFDFYGAKPAGSFKSPKEGKELVSGIRIGRHADRVRIVVDLDEKADLAYNYVVDKDSVIIEVSKGMAVNIGDAAGMGQEIKTASKDETNAAKSEDADVKETASKEESSTSSENQTESKKTYPKMDAVVFSQKETGIGIQIKTSGKPASWKQEKAGQGMLVLDVAGLEVPDKMQQSIDTSDFHSNVTALSIYQSDNQRKNARIVVNVKNDASGSVKETKDGLVWEFAEKKGKSSSPYTGQVTLNLNGELSLEYVSNEDEEAAGGSQIAETSESGATIDVEMPETKLELKKLEESRKKKTYQGEKISLELKDADIRDVLRIIADVSKLNIVASDDVAGLVTVRLINVPWDLALDVILKSKGYGMVKTERIIRVARQTILDAETDAAFKNEVLKLYTKPLQIFLIPVSYGKSDSLVEIVKKVLSPRGEVTFDKRSNMIVVKDIAAFGQKAERLVASLDLQTPQVVIEARIVEAEVNNERGFGIQWGGNALWNSVNGNPTGLAFPSTFGMAGSSDTATSALAGIGYRNQPNWVVNLPVVGSTAGLGFTFGSVGGAYNLDLRLSAMESEGHVKIVSSPRIATMDNTEAKISQGMTIPLVIELVSIDPRTGEQNVSQSIREIKTGIELKVTPHITSDGSIIMKVELEKKDPDFGRSVRGIPTILEKKAETEILVKSGETVVIGGIYTYKTSTTKAGMPFLMNIPVIGWLFKTQEMNESKTELLIFLTPRILVGDEENAGANKQ